MADMMEPIVLYENKATAATVTPDGNGKYKVTLKVETAKRKADGSGNETPMKIDDWIDVGVFSGTKEHLKKLYMEKKKFDTDKSTIEVVVAEKPTFAGVDPYNKLIDRNPGIELGGGGIGVEGQRTRNRRNPSLRLGQTKDPRPQLLTAVGTRGGGGGASGGRSGGIGRSRGRIFCGRWVLRRAGRRDGRQGLRRRRRG